MKRLVFFFVLSSCLFLLAGYQNSEIKTAEQTISKYYEALINKDFTTAFLLVELFQTESTPYEQLKGIDEKQALDFYLRKSELFNQINFEFISYDVKDVITNDKKDFKHRLELKVTLGDEEFIIEDVVSVQEGKLIFEESTDNYLFYRNGEVTDYIINLPKQQRDIIAEQLGIKFVDIKFEDFKKLSSLYIREIFDHELLLKLANNISYLETSVPINYSLINDLNKLEHWILLEPELTDLEFLTNNSSLSVMSLYGGSVHSMKGMETLSYLKELYFLNTTIEDYSFINLSDSLELLIVSNSNLESVDFLSEISNLKQLYINDTPITDISSLVNIQTLEVLNIINSNVVSVAELANLKNLKYVYLDKSKVTDWQILLTIEGITIFDITELYDC